MACFIPWSGTGVLLLRICSHRLALRLVTIPIHTILALKKKKKKKKKTNFENGSRIVVLRGKWHKQSQFSSGRSYLYSRAQTISIKIILGTSLSTQWLRLCAHNAGGLGSIRGQRTRPHMPQPKTPLDATKAKDPVCHT